MRAVLLLFTLCCWGSTSWAFQDGLLAYWPLDEGAGTEISDMASGLYPGSVDGAMWTAGQRGAALDFDGDNDRVWFSGPGITGDALTLALWFKADDFQVGDARLIARATGTSAADHDWMLSTISSGGEYRLRARLRTDGSTHTLVASSGTLQQGVWHHAALIYDGSQMRLFLDGNQVGGTQVSGMIEERYGLGVALGNQPESAGSRPFDGAIDDVRIFASALTPAELTSLIAPCDGPPVASFTLDRSGIAVPVTVAVNASASSDCDGNVQAYDWDFGDGQGASGALAEHTYVAAGTYTITLTVTDDANHTATTTASVHVPETNGRYLDNLLAAYHFTAETGTSVADVSGVAPAMDLTIADGSQVSWVPCGGLAVNGATLIGSTGPASKLIDAVKSSGAITVEAWVTPANITQNGPARIATISNGSSSRNMTLGQDGSEYVMRLRTTTTSDNGLNPHTTTTGDAATVKAQHVVYTRDAAGNATIYVNGQVAGTQMVGGDLSNWDDSYAFALAGEFGADRDWQGVFHLVAIYDTALDAAVIGHQYAVGMPSTCNRAPLARIEADKLAGEAPLLVHVDGTGSSDHEGPIATYAWDFGDGTTAAGTTTHHTFTQPGDYEITLTITDSEGASATRALTITVVAPNEPFRTDDGLLAFYTFTGADGARVFDRSGVDEPLDLTLADPATANRLACAGLSLESDSFLLSDGRGQKMIEAMQSSNALTMEAWIKSDDLNQGPDSPARVATLSGTVGLRNVTLGQKADEWDVRLRTTDTSDNGLPSTTTSGGAASLMLNHVIYTRDANGDARIYVDGILRGQAAVGGDFSNWEDGFYFALGNEFYPNERAWLGDYYLVAVYDRALADHEITQNFRAGVSGLCLGIAMDRPADGLLTHGDTVTVSGSVSHPGSKVMVNGMPAQVTDTDWTVDLPLTGENDITVTAVAMMGGKTAAISHTVIRDTTAPTITLNAPTSVYQGTDLVYDWLVEDRNGLAEVTVHQDGLDISTQALGSHSDSVPVEAELRDILLTIRAVDGAGNHAEKTHRVTVFPPCSGQPTAAFTATRTGLIPATVAVDATASLDCDGRIVDYAWDFGDGNTASGSTATHVYSALGSYAITLTVTDDAGLTDSETQILVLRDPSLIAEYHFNQGTGTTINDVSGVTPAYDLEIQDPGHVTWLACGGLQVDSSTLIRGFEPATKMIEAAKTSGELSLEAWIATSDLTQSGPARIATLSDGTTDRNLTLGQDGETYVLRLRTTATGNNGTNPATQTDRGTVEARPTHVLYTRDADGVATMYIDGQAVAVESVPGALSNWADDYAFALANEIGADRTWLGTFYHVAFYDAALSPERVLAQYEAGLPQTGLPVACNRPPQARIAVDRLAGEAPLQVHFDGNESRDADGTIVTWNWSFGDDRNASGEAVQHVFNNPGIYGVTLTVVDDDGATASRDIQITVVPPGEVVRVDDGLELLYTFREKSGNRLHDDSGTGTPLDLVIKNPDPVTWLACGGLTINGDTIARSERPARSLIQRLKTTHALTIEAWIAPANLSQGSSSPARIATLSDTTTERNVTLGQKAGEYDVRLRTTTNSHNGNSPSTTTSGGAVDTVLTHVVYVRDPGGTARIYVDNQVRAEIVIDGDLSNWDDAYFFALGNEINPMERAFLGEFHLVAAYSRALSEADVARNFQAGLGGMCPNHPPVFITEAPTSAEAGLPLNYAAQASDPDGDPLTYGLDLAPEGMTIDADTGVVNWMPTAAQRGEHHIEITANDGRNGWALQRFTIQVSLADLRISIQTPSEGLLTQAHQIEMTGTVSNPLATVTVMGIPAIQNGNDWAVTIPLDSEGSIQLEAVASFESVTATTTRTIIRDVTPPAIQLNAPTDITRLDNLTFDWSVSDANALDSVAVTRDDVFVSDLASGTSSYAVLDDPNLTTIVLAVAATDAAGNRSDVTQTVQVVDPTVLSVHIISPIDPFLTAADTVTVAGTVNQTDAVVTLNGLATVQSGNEWTLDFNLANEGPIVLEALAVSGGQSASATRTIIRDTTPPVVVLTAPSEARRTESFDFNWTVTDANALNSVTVTRDNEPVSDQAIGNGNYTVPDDPAITEVVLSVSATDGAGNSVIDSATVPVKPPAPIVTINQPAEGTLTNASSITVAGTVSPVDAVVLLNGQATVQDGSNWSRDVDLTIEGSIVLEAVATAAGETATATRSILRDSIAPLVTLDAPSQVIAGQDILLNWMVDESNALTEVTVLRDGATLATFPDGSTTAFAITTDPAEAGSATELRVTARDAAGNLGDAVVTVSLNETGIVLDVDEPAEGDSFANSQVVFSGRVQPADASVTVNGEPATVLDGAWQVTISLSDGEHAIVIEASKPGLDTLTEIRNIRVDTQAPVIAIQAPAEFVRGETYDITITADDSTTISALAFTAGSQSFAPVAAASVTHQLAIAMDEAATELTLTASATDALGNQDEATRTVPVVDVSDKEPVVITITSHAHPTLTDVAVQTITGTVIPADAQLTRAGVDIPMDAGMFTYETTLQDGLNTVLFNATHDDYLPGNAKLDLFLDHVDPIITLITPSQDYYTNQPHVTVTGQVSDLYDERPSLSRSGSPVAMIGDRFIDDQVPLVR